MEDSEFECLELIKTYKLSKEESDKQVSDAHLEIISRSRCKHWKRLASHLEMSATVVSDIRGKPIEEEDKRHDFLHKWKEKKGSKATYKQLVLALLKIECRDDAEKVCEILKNSQIQESPPALDEPKSLHTKPQRSNRNKRPPYNLLKPDECKDLVCAICLDVARDPQQHVGSGKLLCKECLEEHGCKRPCPLCKVENPQYFPDQRAKSDIQDLLVKCANEKKGCDWRGTHGTLEEHQTSCKFAKAKLKAGEEFCEKCSAIHKEGQPFLYCQREKYKDNGDNAIFETPRTDQYCTPSKVQHVFEVYFDTSQRTGANPYGKWMVHNHFDKIDATWVKIRTAIAENRLAGCVSAICSTTRYNPSKQGPGPRTKGRIGVYTDIENKDAIGFAMIEITKEDVKYKTNKATSQGKYVSAGDGVVSQKTIFWNTGNPSIEKEGEGFDPLNSNSYEIEDIWKLNLVEAPEPIKSNESYGHWVLSLKPKELTELWHLLKELIESKEHNYGIICMECPQKDVRYSRELAKFKVYTSKEDKDQVGKDLIELERGAIVYCHDGRSEGELFWNNGKPSNKQQEKRN